MNLRLPLIRCPLCGEPVEGLSSPPSTGNVLVHRTCLDAIEAQAAAASFWNVVRRWFRSADRALEQTAARLYTAHVEALQGAGVLAIFTEWESLTEAERAPWCAAAKAAKGPCP